MNRALALALTSLSWLAPVVAADNAAHPLLDLAREMQAAPDKRPRRGADRSDVPEAEHALKQAQVPKDAECASSLGASRYADVYADLAAARNSQGDYPGAVAAYRSALACRPHDPEIYRSIGSILASVRDYAGAREALNASLAIDPRDVEANRTMGNLDFIAGHWADAIARFRYVAASDANRTHAEYGQLMLWLAQSRAGVAKPELVVRTPAEGWPQPLLLFLHGQYTEAEIVVRVKEGDDDHDAEEHTSIDERLCEALYYVGEAYLARGQPEVALEYFAAVVNLKVLHYIEHGLALAEISKLRK